MNIYYKLFLIMAMVSLILFLIMAIFNIEQLIIPVVISVNSMIVLSVISEIKVLKDLRKMAEDLRDEIKRLK